MSAPVTLESLMSDVTDPQTKACIVAWWEKNARREANLATVSIPPCPPWCRDVEIVDGRTVHLYDLVSPDDEHHFSRVHVSGNGDVYVAQEEHNRHGVVTLDAAYIVASGDEEEELTAAQARVRASELLNAADHLDELTR